MICLSHAWMNDEKTEAETRGSFNTTWEKVTALGLRYARSSSLLTT
jgi:hypothetical protein